MTEKQKQNHLRGEISPYLIQHADNPVMWYPWGRDAFRCAKIEDKPIFLSIGYSTCHWCHVMEQESFQDSQVADLLNRHFVSIKVDREERPDVDATYMRVCQMMTGSGGWPLTIVMTPEREPFFAATYIPRTSRYGRQGMIEILPRIAALWQSERELVTGTVHRIKTAVAEVSRPTVPVSQTQDVQLQAINRLKATYDERYGGFGSAPKFPSPHLYQFLLLHGTDRQDPEAIDMVVQSLSRMCMGGIHDQVGGGFHRYATDARWQVPHFEKMLVDQAMMATTLSLAGTATQNRHLQATASRTLDFVLTEMRDPLGGFHTALDADSPTGEGAFYTWTLAELKDVLGQPDADQFADLFHCRAEGNFSDHGHPESRRNVLHMSPESRSAAMAFHGNEEELETWIAGCMGRLKRERDQRDVPFRDDKILADWNGLMIQALATAARYAWDRRFLEAAREGGHFLCTHMYKDGRLMHSYRNGTATVPGFLDDYAAVGLGFLSLFEVTQEPLWLQRALQTARSMCGQFREDESGGFHMTSPEHETLLVRPREVVDGAYPCGNSLAFQLLVRLEQLVGSGEFQDIVDQTAQNIRAASHRYPAGIAYGLKAELERNLPTEQIIVTSAQPVRASLPLLEPLMQTYAPFRQILLRTPQTADQLDALCPHTGAYGIPDTGQQYYLCTGMSCRQPVHSAEAVLEMIAKRER